MITLKLDKKGGINKGDINMIESDNKSDVYIIQLYKEGAIYNLTGKTIELNILEKRRKYGDTFTLPVYEATQGKIKLEVVEGMTKTDGLFYFQITVKDGKGLVDNFPIFPVEIKNSIKDEIIGTVVASPYMKILLDAVEQAESAVDLVKGIENNYKTVKKEIQTNYNEIKDNIQTDYLKVKEGIQKDYNSLQQIMMDGNQAANLQAQINKNKSQLESIANKGTTIEVLEKATKEEIERQIEDGRMANLTIADGSIGKEKLSPDIKISILDKLTENDGSLFFNNKEVGKKTIDDTVVSPEYSWSSDKIYKKLFTKTRTVNLYNKDNAIFDKFINPSGNVANYDGYSYNEEYVEVPTTGRVYLTPSHDFIIAQYNDAKSLVKQDKFKGGFLETSTKYIRICVKKEYINSFMLVIGQELPKQYVPYYKEILNTNIEISSSNMKTIDDTIVSSEYSWSSDKISKTMFTKIRTVNLYNKDNAIFDKFINPSGVVTAYNGYSYNEEYIEVSSTTGRVYLSASHNCIIAQYNDTKGLVKQDTFKSNYLEASTKYIRICVKKDFISSFMLVVGRELPTEYTPYYKEILNTNIEVSPSNIKNADELSKNMKMGKNNLSQELLPTFFICESIGKFSFLNFDISDLIGGETNVTVSYKIKIHSLASGIATTTINYRLFNDTERGFGLGTGLVNKEMGEVKTGVGVANEITYNFTLTNTRRYLKVVNWVKDGISTYDIWDLKVTVNGVNITPFETGSYTSTAVPIPGTITDLNKNGCSLATIEYLNKVGIAGGGSGSSSNKLKGKKAIFLGDSITFGGTYPATLKLSLELLEATKLATNGWTSADLVNNKEKIPTDTDVISVWIGINDFIQGRPLGTNADRDNKTFYGSLHTLCSYLAQNFVGKKIGFYTPLHCNHNAFTSPDSLNKQELKVEDYRKVIHEVCSYYSIPVCDLHAISGIAPHIESHRVLYTSDGLHLNAKGYEKVVPCMIDFLQSL